MYWHAMIRAKRIRNKPRVHEHVSVGELRAMLLRERAETARLRGLMRQMETEARVMREMWAFSEQATGSDATHKRVTYDTSDHKSVTSDDALYDDKSSSTSSDHSTQSTLSTSTSSSDARDEMSSVVKQVQSTAGTFVNMSTTLQTWSERTQGNEGKHKT